MTDWRQRVREDYGSDPHEHYTDEQIDEILDEIEAAHYADECDPLSCPLCNKEDTA